MKLDACHDSEKALIFNELSNSFADSVPVKRLKYARKAEKFARQFNNNFELAKAYENMAYGYRGISNYDSALICINNSLLELETSENP